MTNEGDVRPLVVAWECRWWIVVDSDGWYGALTQTKNMYCTGEQRRIQSYLRLRRRDRAMASTFLATSDRRAPSGPSSSASKDLVRQRTPSNSLGTRLDTVLHCIRGMPRLRPVHGKQGTKSLGRDTGSTPADERRVVTAELSSKVTGGKVKSKEPTELIRETVPAEVTRERVPAEVTRERVPVRETPERDPVEETRGREPTEEVRDKRDGARGDTGASDEFARETCPENTPSSSRVAGSTGEKAGPWGS